MGGSSTAQAVEDDELRAPHLSPEKSPRRLGLATGALSALLALASGLVVTQVLRQGVPEATTHPMSGRLGYYLEHPADFDTLFVGSSRVFRGIVPQAFDARMAELGRPTRSLNLGEPGMRAYEIDRLVRLLLARNQGDLRTLFIDPGVRSPKRDEDETQRAVEWHSARQTFDALRTTRALELEGDVYRRLVTSHLRMFAMRQSNYGLGPVLVDRFGWQPPAEPGWLVRGGYKSLEAESKGSFKRRRRDFLQRQQAYERMVARYTRRPATTLAGETVLRLERWRRQGLLAEREGVDAVALVAPGYGRLSHLGDGALGGSESGGMVLLNFDDPAGYPQLFDPASRFDAVHLNAEAALGYSRLVAERWMEASTPGR